MTKKLLTSLLLCASSALNAANYLTFTAEADNSSFGIMNFGDNNPYVQYSLDEGKTWTRLESGTLIPLIRKGDKALLRGYNPSGFSKHWVQYTQFVMPKGVIAASGSVMSLVDGTGESLKIPAPFCFHYLFYDCKSLNKAPELPATELTDVCYSDMFRNCTRLKQMPELPALIMAENCYARMFEGCSNLIQTCELPSTTLRKSCYEGMFWDCTNLVKAPKLPALIMEEKCYARMFRGCTNLTEAPILPAPHVMDFCYEEMFQDCPKISKIEVNISEWGIYVGIRTIYEDHEEDEAIFTQSTENWLKNVASTGTFICPKELPSEFGENAIPVGWKVIRVKQHTYEDVGPNVRIDKGGVIFNYGF